MGPMHDWHLFTKLLSNLHLVVVPLVGAGLAVLQRFRQRMRENRAAAWPSSEAVVQSVDIQKRHGNWVTIRYRYYARQEYRYGSYRRRFGKMAAAQSFADAARGRTFQVRFNESDPNTSVLMERDLQLGGLLQLH